MLTRDPYRRAGFTAPGQAAEVRAARATAIRDLTPAQLALVRQYNEAQPGNKRAARRMARKGQDA